MKKFWNWVRDETEPQERTLRLEGTIADGVITLDFEGVELVLAK